MRGLIKSSFKVLVLLLTTSMGVVFLGVVLLGGATPLKAAPKAATAIEPSTRFAPVELEQALQNLRRRGLQIVFSRELIRPEMRVETKPKANRPEEVLREILKPHGLTAIEGAGGTLLVVSVDQPKLVARAVSGLVRSRHDQRPQRGALVRLDELNLLRESTSPLGGGQHFESRTNDQGRFVVADLPPGAYRLDVQAAGFIPLRDSQIIVEPNRDKDLLLELDLVPFMHEEIVVGASRVGLLADDPSSPLSLNRKEVEALPHLGGDVFRALNFLPGAVSNDNSAQFSIHGGRGDEVKIMLDGQELYDAFHLKDFDTGLSVIASEALDGVTQSTGAFGAWHGDRMSAVLDLTTQTPKERFTSVELSALTLQLATGGAFKNRGTWLVNARRGSIDLASRLFGREDPEFWDLFSKLELDVSQRHHLGIRILRTDDLLNFGEVVEGLEKRFETDYDSSYLWGSHDAVLGSRQLAQTTLSFSNIGRDRVGFEEDEDQNFSVSDLRDVDVFGLKHAFSLQLQPGHSLGLGVELRRYEVDYTYNNRTAPPLLPATPWFQPRSPALSFGGQFISEHLSTWASDRFDLTDNLVVELGVRYDRHTLTDDTLVSPRANVAWRVGKNNQIHLGWGHFFQSQRPYELGVEDGETSFVQAEKAEHWVLGFEHLFTNQRQPFLRALRLETYKRSIDDPRDRFANLYEPINTFPEVEPDRVRFNPEKAAAEGIELLLRGFAGDKTDWWLSYAFSKAEDRLAGEWFRRRQDQPHALNLAMSRHLPRAWQLDIAWRFHTGWPTTPIALVPSVAGNNQEDAEAGEIVLGRLNSQRLSDYHRLDMRLSKTFALKRSQMRIYLDVQNAYDRKNAAGFDLKLEDGGLTKQPERWVGIFPSLGVVWRW